MKRQTITAITAALALLGSTEATTPMRTANYRDNVLWAIAYKLGLDPATQGSYFLRDQARSLASYINAWVRRLWDAADWPEWTPIIEATPVNDVVPYSPTDGTEIGSVLKVYLTDPRATPGFQVFDTPFRLQPDGIYVGGDHGATVWIKCRPPAPQFTSDEWDPDRIYNAGELAYLPNTGECYRSIGNNNRGNYPGEVGRRQPIQTEISQAGTRDNPGLAEKPEILVFYFTGLSVPPDPPNVPANGSVFNIGIYDSTLTLIGSSFHTADGVETLGAIITAMATALDASLPASFTVTPDATAKTITVQDNSIFTSAYAWYEEFSPFLYHPLRVKVAQNYIPPVAVATGQKQITNITLAATQAIGGEVYAISFIDQSGQVHSVNYTAAAGDTEPQILAGLIAAMQTAQATDNFFNDIFAAINGSTLTLSTAALANVDATMERAPVPPDPIPRPPVPQPPTFWEYVPFPLALVDQVVDGAYADALKEEGQPEKAAAEIQAALTDSQVRQGAFQAPQYDALTDQQRAKSRYAVR